jgi:hypothetical protein
MLIDIELLDRAKERKPAKLPNVVTAVIIRKNSKKSKKHHKGLRRRAKRIKTKKLESLYVTKQMGQSRRKLRN